MFAFMSYVTILCKIQKKSKFQLRVVHFCNIKQHSFESYVLHLVTY